MDRPLTIEDFPDRDRRWLVHIFATLQNHIQDEMECPENHWHDTDLYTNQERFGRLWTYVYDELTRCMERTHVQEALLVSGCKELEGTNIAPDLT